MNRSLFGYDYYAHKVIRSSLYAEKSEICESIIFKKCHNCRLENEWEIFISFNRIFSPVFIVQNLTLVHISPYIDAPIFIND